MTIPALTTGVIVLAAALATVPLAIRLAPRRRMSTALPAAAIAMAAAAVTGFALLAQSCMDQPCIAAGTIGGAVR